MINSFKCMLTMYFSLSVMFSQSADIYFGDFDLDNNSLNVMYNSDIEIGGAQFDLVGATFDSYTGGEAGAAGWTVSGSETTWIGFSFAGIGLPIGENVLTEIIFSPTGEEICLSGVVFSDNAGNTIDVNIGDCASLSGGSDIEGCTDMSACNYDENATSDCGGDNSCCEYAMMYYDCDGNCLNDENGNGTCDELEVEEGCTDETALNFGADSDCLFDLFDDWIQSTAQSFYVFNGLEINGEMVSNDDSLYVIGAYCGDDTSSVLVGSAQWMGSGTTLVVMGTDGITEGTDDYCFGGFQLVIPADIPTFVIYDAEGDEVHNAEFNMCYDSNGNESDCAWADFGYNNIELLYTIDLEGCTDMDACNYDETTTLECNGDNSCCEYADEYYDCDGNCENDFDEDEVCDELEVIGCMDYMACNYDDEATDDSECFYEEDCNGECGGTAEYDECGVCEGDGSSCVTFYFETLGMFTEENCSGDIIDTINGLCFYPYTGNMIPSFSQEDCEYSGGTYIELPTCLDIFTLQPSNYDNEDECMCGEGGEWNTDMEECDLGEQGLYMWLDEMPLFDDEGWNGPESISLLYDEYNNPTDAIIHHEYVGECHWDYGPSPDEYVCEQYDGDWNDYDMECDIYDEDDCNELGGYWEDGGDQILGYSVDLNQFFLEDEEIVFEIINTEGGTALIANMIEGDCENDLTYEECVNADWDWNDYDMACEIDDEDACNELNGEWIEEGCFAMVFTNDQLNIFGCTEEDNPYYNEGAIINDGSCSLSNTEYISPNSFFLSDNYPNPFNPVTQYSYTIPEYSKVELAIYDIQGNLVKSIFNGHHKPGKYNVTFDGSEFASGFYVMVLDAGDVVLSKKMILLK